MVGRRDSDSPPASNAPTLQPTTSASLTTTPQPTPVGSNCFQEREVLLRAIDDYLAGDSESTSVAQMYGHPIGSWSVPGIDNFSEIFSAQRKPAAATFDRSLDGWNTSRVRSMFQMMSGASAFNQPLRRGTRRKLRTCLAPSQIAAHLINHYHGILQK